MKLSDVKFLKMKGSDYRDQVKQSSPIENFPEFMPWSQKFFGAGCSREAFDRGIRMTRDNRKTFKEHFGKCAFVFKGSEFYFHGWLADLGTVEVIVLTAKGKGTCFEVVTNYGLDKYNIRTVLQFMEMVGNLKNKDEEQKQ